MDSYIYPVFAVVISVFVTCAIFFSIYLLVWLFYKQIGKLYKKYKRRKMENYYLYILKCSDGSLYTGISTDPDRRLLEHNESNSRGSKYTRARRPVSLVFKKHVGSLSDALKLEHKVKKLSRIKKVGIITGQTDLNDV